MNIVDTIRSQMSSEQFSQLGSMLGTSEETARTAVEAAVPSLLAMLGKLTASVGGVGKLLTMLIRFAPGAADTRVAGNTPDQVRQGDELLGSLFGPGVFNQLGSLLSKFGGLSNDSMRKLLSYLAPMVLGGIASQMTRSGQKFDQENVTRFFSEQKNNIENSLPVGFSLADIPTFDSSPVQPSQQESSSPARWFVPVVALGAIAVAVVFYYNRNSPTLNVPSPSEMKTSVADACKSLTARLDKINDLKSAEQAVPELKQLAKQFAAMKSVSQQVSPTDREQIKETINRSVARLDEQVARLAWTPGVTEKIRPEVDAVVEKLGDLTGNRPELPMANVSNEFSQLFNSISTTISNIKDATTATEAMPKFKQASQRIDQVRATLERLPQESRTTMTTMLKPAVDHLRQNFERTLTQEGVSEKIKPTVDEILNKLNQIGG